VPNRLTILVAIGAATLAVAAPAVAAPSAKDAKAAVARAHRAIDVSFSAARSNGPHAADRVAEAERLQARASRLARRVGSDRGAQTAARLLRLAAGSADAGFDGYADLLAAVPPELQPVILDALERFGELRTDLLADITEVADLLPPSAREQALAAITAFAGDGDVEALIATLTDPDFVATLQAQLEALIGDLTGLSPDEMFDPPDLTEILPPDLCTQISAMLEELGLPAGPDFCGFAG
jgi:hypothetical protein